MKIFIDFDDVIFNTFLLRKHFLKIFNKNGVPKALFIESYKKFKKQSISYSPLIHLKFLSKNKNIDSKKILSGLNKLLENKKYLFKDAEKFLKRFSKNDIYLISYGDSKFQKQKIKSSGVGKYFKRIIIAKTNKGEIIRDVIKKDGFKKGERIIFIDDKLRHINEVKQIKNKDIITFRIARPLNSFKKIEKMIKNA